MTDQDLSQGTYKQSSMETTVDYRIIQQDLPYLPRSEQSTAETPLPHVVTGNWFELQPCY
jgi:hypothetical protein